MLSGTEGSFIYEFTDGKYIPKPSIELSHLTQVSLFKIQLNMQLFNSLLYNLKDH